MRCRTSRRPFPFSFKENQSCNPPTPATTAACVVSTSSSRPALWMCCEPRIETMNPLGKRAVNLPILDACWIMADPCPFLTPEHRCDIYPSRPNSCVAFAAGSAKCQELRKEHRIAPLVPTQVPEVMLGAGPIPGGDEIVTEILQAILAEDAEESATL